MKTTKQVKRIYRGKTWKTEQKKKETQKLYWKIFFWVTAFILVGIAGTWNHYTQEYNKLSTEVIEAIKSNVKIEKVQAANPYGFKNIKEISSKVVVVDTTSEVKSNYKLSTQQRETEQAISQLAKKVCSEYGFEDFCVRDLMGMAFKETSFECWKVGDNGTSFGCWQIHLKAHKHITQEQAKDMDFAINWTLKRMVSYGYPKYRSNAIMRHNGTPGIEATLSYLDAVNKYVKSTK